jgi:hypothetical protein
MKVSIFEDRTLSLKLRRMGVKTKSHGTFRAKRHPNSPRVRTAAKARLYS